MKKAKKNKKPEGQLFLLQATYSSFSWIYRTTKDPDDFKRPPDLLGVFEEVGATIHGFWYAFGEYDLAAIVEVPDTVGIAALLIAMRLGDIPQDLLFYLLCSKRFDDTSLGVMLYKQSGLLGPSWSSGDMRELQDSDDPRAFQAVAAFVYAMTKMVGAYASVLSGLYALVFTAVIAENSAPVRSALCRALAWLSVTLDETANRSNGSRIAGADSRVSVWVIATNEELMIAQQTLALIRA